MDSTGTHRPRNASSKGRIVQGTHRLRDASSKGCIVQEAHRPRVAPSKGRIVQGTNSPRAVLSQGRIIQGTHPPRTFARGHTGRGRIGIAPDWGGGGGVIILTIVLLALDYVYCIHRSAENSVPKGAPLSDAKKTFRADVSFSGGFTCINSTQVVDVDRLQRILAF
jgi:hypothetical protein